MLEMNFIMSSVSYDISEILSAEGAARNEVSNIIWNFILHKALFSVWFEQDRKEKCTDRKIFTKTKGYFYNNIGCNPGLWCLVA